MLPLNMYTRIQLKQQCLVLEQKVYNLIQYFFKRC